MCVCLCLVQLLLGIYRNTPPPLKMSTHGHVDGCGEAFLLTSSHILCLMRSDIEIISHLPTLLHFAHLSTQQTLQLDFIFTTSYYLLLSYKFTDDVRYVTY